MKAALTFLILFSSALAQAQQIRGVPKLPSSESMGLQGSAGTGFADFSVGSPSSDWRVNRGMYVAIAIERGFEVMNLYLTLSLSNMTSDGTSNYRYTPLSSPITYTATNIKYRSNVMDLGLGLKLKLIDGYWFRPYVEGGVLGGYHQITYDTGGTTLAAQGSEYKTTDVVMGSGSYAEGGIEIMFSEQFGVKLAGRASDYTTKPMETFDTRSLKFRTETYYFSLLFGM
jgi:hypothetical protein